MSKGISNVRRAFALGSIVVMALLLPTVAIAAPVIADSYPQSNWFGSASMNPSSATQVGQSFTAIDGTLDSAQFWLGKQGAPTGNAYAVLYAITGTYGTNSVPTGLALATSAPVDVATISSPLHLVSFVFDNTLTLTAGTKYAIVVHKEGGDASNYLLVGEDLSSPTHSGNMCFYQAPFGWASNPNDVIFYLYENPIAPPPVVPTPASSPWSLALLTLGAVGVALLTRRTLVSG